MFLRLLFTFPSLPWDFEFFLSQHSLLLSVSGRKHLEAASIYCWHIYHRAPLCSTGSCVTTQTLNYCSSLPAQEKPNVISWFYRNCLSQKLEGLLFLRSPFKCSLWDDLESLGHKGCRVLMGVGLELVPVPERCWWTPALSCTEGRGWRWELCSLPHPRGWDLQPTNGFLLSRYRCYIRKNFNFIWKCYFQFLCCMEKLNDLLKVTWGGFGKMLKKPRSSKLQP